jgi:hypothetical protein
LARAALEAVALEGVRSGKLTVSQARRLLGIESRYEMDGFLKAHGVFLDYWKWALSLSRDERASRFAAIVNANRK